MNAGDNYGIIINREMGDPSIAYRRHVTCRIYNYTASYRQASNKLDGYRRLKDCYSTNKQTYIYIYLYIYIYMHTHTVSIVE